MEEAVANGGSERGGRAGVVVLVEGAWECGRRTGGGVGGGDNGGEHGRRWWNERVVFCFRRGRGGPALRGRLSGCGAMVRRGPVRADARVRATAGDGRWCEGDRGGPRLRPRRGEAVVVCGQVAQFPDAGGPGERTRAGRVRGSSGRRRERSAGRDFS
jgi:hypothetical protein